MCVHNINNCIKGNESKIGDFRKEKKVNNVFLVYRNKYNNDNEDRSS